MIPTPSAHTSHITSSSNNVVNPGSCCDDDPVKIRQGPMNRPKSARPDMPHRRSSLDTHHIQLPAERGRKKASLPLNLAKLVWGRWVRGDKSITTVLERRATAPVGALPPHEFVPRHQGAGPVLDKTEAVPVRSTVFYAGVNIAADHTNLSPFEESYSDGDEDNDHPPTAAPHSATANTKTSSQNQSQNHTQRQNQNVWLCSPPPSPPHPTIKPPPRSHPIRPYITRSTSTGRLATEFDTDGRVICLSDHSERVLSRTNRSRSGAAPSCWSGMSRSTTELVGPGRVGIKRAVTTTGYGLGNVDGSGSRAWESLIEKGKEEREEVLELDKELDLDLELQSEKEPGRGEGGGGGWRRWWVAGARA